MSKRRKLISLATIVLVSLIGATILFSNRIGQSSPGPSEPASLKDLVEFPSATCSANLTDVLVDLKLTARFTHDCDGFADILTSLNNLGFSFDLGFGGYNAINVTGTVQTIPFDGTALFDWSSNALANGERGLIVGVIMDDGTNFTLGIVTNLLPPSESATGYIIRNAMPYVHIRFYWWAWNPIGKIVSWEYWWYDSQSHPNWFWSCYWWWRVYLRNYYPTSAYQEWHWHYWKTWYWWSTCFQYN